ncbi:hypothetical protein GIB67_015755 [Kingdonia uniflora]|uniref:Uncharacterized protein n=1 Tax=Kingdonia uniflora TaxID=39325 RepID=A0A7J7NUM2_9MAGN|nr:hypothetical protein GIB67_015755 [Kingdonia uniflora]
MDSIAKDEIGGLSGRKILSTSLPRVLFSKSSSRLSFQDEFDDFEFSCPFDIDDDDLTNPVGNIDMDALKNSCFPLCNHIPGINNMPFTLFLVSTLNLTIVEYMLGFFYAMLKLFNPLHFYMCYLPMIHKGIERHPWYVVRDNSKLETKEYFFLELNSQFQVYKLIYISRNTQMYSKAAFPTALHRAGTCFSNNVRMKLKYIDDHSLEMAIPAPIPLTYQDLTGEVAVEAEEDFYYKWRFYAFVFTGEERWACLRTLMEDRVRGSYEGIEGNITLTSYRVSHHECRMVRKRYGNRENKYVKKKRGVVMIESFKILENTQRERRKIRGFDNELSEGDKRFKRAKDYGSHRWLYSSIVREKLDATTDSYSDTKEIVFKMGSSPVNEVSTSGLTNEPDIEEEVGLEQFPGVKPKLERKESLLDEVMEEEIELELVVEELCLSRIKRVDSRSNKVQKALSTWSMTGVDEGKRQISGEEARTNISKTPRTGSLVQPNPVKLSKIALKYPKKRMLKVLSATAPMKVVRPRKIRGGGSNPRVKAEANFDEMVEEHGRLGHHLMLKSYFEEEVEAIKADTYVEEEDEEEAEVVRIVGGLDGVSRQMVLDNQGNDVELPEGGSKKEG